MVIDIIIALLLVAAVLNGLRKGFIAQLVSIVSLILGVWLSCRFASFVGAWSAEKLNTSVRLMNAIAFTVIFVFVVLAIIWLGKFVEKTVKILLLTWLNRLLGVLFALLKFLLIIGLVLILFDSINSDAHIVKESYLSSSILYYPLRNAVTAVFPYMRDILAAI